MVFCNQEAVCTQNFSYSVDVLRGRGMVDHATNVLVDSLVTHVCLTASSAGLHKLADHFLQLFIRQTHLQDGHHGCTVLNGDVLGIPNAQPVDYSRDDALIRH